MIYWEYANASGQFRVARAYIGHVKWAVTRQTGGTDEEVTIATGRSAEEALAALVTAGLAATLRVPAKLHEWRELHQ